MKTAFRAKIIFEAEDLPYDLTWTMEEICKAIRSKNFEIEVVDDFLTNNLEPVIMFKYKPKKKGGEK